MILDEKTPFYKDPGGRASGAKTPTTIVNGQTQVCAHDLPFWSGVGEVKIRNFQSAIIFPTLK